MCDGIPTIRGWVCHTDLTGMLVFLTGYWGFSHPLEYLSAVGTSPAGCGISQNTALLVYPVYVSYMRVFSSVPVHGADTVDDLER